jgi:hypothetical protein
MALQDFARAGLPFLDGGSEVQIGTGTGELRIGPRDPLDA